MAGYAWIGLHLFFPGIQETSFTVCLFRNITSIPCPSCGITRSLFLIIGGDLQGALLMNPLGFITALGLVTLPCWILTDILTNRPTLAQSILWTEKKIKSKRIIYMPLVALALINWGWNILKEL